MHLALQTSEECHGKEGMSTYLVGAEVGRRSGVKSGAKEDVAVLRPDQIC